ncbi:MAG: hypothetical protein UY61_C0072G0005 [Candidatus Adlerbacteria bacterium GW2011_GWC1_50_9]|uniref:ASCH domain-containing protein n=1 Tax=Candidatus Adlerbacteria bacterium GW2011_GWC1_50_9 TaxID=1618608 RepID=A0A0G1ZI00_9BACT|nr:MAG: hypothetical protein UY61_C0072G0005 [Candidatus Adlerbacteria bacterium GW2011_GWC1_50_9]
MKTWILRIRAENRIIFNQIKSGRKKVETRAFGFTKTGKNFRSVQKGDTLLFMCSRARLRKKVKKIKKFRTIDVFFEKVNQKLVWPHLERRTLSEIKKQYYAYPGYKERIWKHGLVAFWI